MFSEKKMSQRLSLIIAGTLVLAACGSGGGNNAGNASPAAPPANEATAPAIGVAANGSTANFNGAAPVAGVTRDFLIGSWATDSCDVPSATYAADGTTDGGRRRWALEGDRLIVTGGPRREQSVVERLGDDRMRLNTADGPFELRRCPAAER